MVKTITQIATEYADNHELELEDEQQVCYDACTHGARAVLIQIEEKISEMHVAAIPESEWIFANLTDFCEKLRK